MDLHKIIVGLLIILIVLILYKKQENAGNTSITAGGLNNFSAEALANIAKVYADTRQTAAFNNITVTSTADIKKSNLMPKGGIIIWSGDQVPAGWGLCDGTSYPAVDGTGSVQSPDLRGRFVLGSGQGQDLTARNKGDKGGAETHKLTVEEMPSHNHPINTANSTNEGCSAARNPPIGRGAGITTGCDAQIGQPDRFTDAWSIPWLGKIGGDKAHNNMPPFYVLAYIIKL